MTWQRDLPESIGTLPGGAPLWRTDPGGPWDARVLVLGVYPAAVETRVVEVDGLRINLPWQTERTSFEPGSASGGIVDTHLLQPLGLGRDDVCMTDVWPYLLANTTPSTSGRSMADNVELWESWTGMTTGIARRPSPPSLLRKARTTPGNIDRIKAVLRARSPRLLLTLGSEAAAFVRTLPYNTVARQANELLYQPPARFFVLGVPVDVVHLAHPHHMLPHRRTEPWVSRHEAWLAGPGRRLVSG